MKVNEIEQLNVFDMIQTIPEIKPLKFSEIDIDETLLELYERGVKDER